MKASGRFVGELITKFTGKLRKGRVLYELHEPLSFVLTEMGTSDRSIDVPAGFKTDYASVPRFFWRIVPPGGLYASAAVIHDYLYYYKIGTRKEADQIFLVAMKVAGVSRMQRRAMYRAVRMFGNNGWGK